MGFPHTALTESVVKFLSAPGGQRGFTLFWPFLVFAASQISVLQNPLLFRRKHVFFPLFALAVPCENKGEEQEAEAKQARAGQDGICLFWGWVSSSEVLTVLLQLWQSVWDRDIPTPSRTLSLLPLLWEGLCPVQGMPSPETDPNCYSGQWLGMVTAL